MTEEELEALRRHGFGVAYRMLGSVTEAEDVTQEALLRLAQQDGSINEPAAWMTTCESVRSARIELSPRPRCYTRALSRHTARPKLRTEWERDTAALLRRVEAGERLRVTVHGHPVAELVPAGQPQAFTPFDRVAAGLRGLMRADDRLDQELRDAGEPPLDPFE